MSFEAPAEREPLLSERLEAVRNLAEVHVRGLSRLDFEEQAIREILSRLNFSDFVRKIKALESGGFPIGDALKQEARVYVAAAMVQEIIDQNNGLTYFTDKDLDAQYQQTVERYHDAVYELAKIKHA